MERAIARAGLMSPGEDEMCYIMFSGMGEVALGRLLRLYNRVWEDGQLPKSWKEAVVIPIRKPGKDPTKPTSYRPIALTSHVCKVMERMIMDRLVYFLEKRELITWGTMDPVLCLEDEIRKAQVNKETVVAVFFDVEKAYDMMWKEGLMIKMEKMGIGGRAFNWVKDFLYGRSIRVRVGK